MRFLYRDKVNIPTNYSVTRAVLDILLDFEESTGLFATPYRRTIRGWRKLNGEPEPPPWRYNRAIKYLKDRAKIKIIKKNNQKFLKLTRTGKLQALLARIDQDFKKHPVWDGKWRLVIWDIPEKSRNDRNRLRQLVKDLDFLQLQKSVFITPYPLPASAVEYLKESKLIRYIRFLRVDKIEDDRYLKKRFALK